MKQKVGGVVVVIVIVVVFSKSTGIMYFNTAKGKKKRLISSLVGLLKC